MVTNNPLTVTDRLAQALAETPGVAFAVMIGSRANHTARESSDWDIAVFWKSPDNSFARLGQHEALRHRLAQCLELQDEKIDLIDLASARLAMKAVVAEEGIIVNRP
jgi:predicted nucleotidyltransferase